MISMYWDVMSVLKARLDLRSYTKLNLEPMTAHESLAWIQSYLNCHKVDRENKYFPGCCYGVWERKHGKHHA